MKSARLRIDNYLIVYPWHRVKKTNGYFQMDKNKIKCSTKPINLSSDYSNYVDEDYLTDTIDLQWVKLKQKLAYPRADLVAITMPVKFTSQRGERQSSRKRKARVLYQAGFI